MQLVIPSGFRFPGLLADRLFIAKKPLLCVLLAVAAGACGGGGSGSADAGPSSELDAAGATPDAAEGSPDAGPIDPIGHSLSALGVDIASTLRVDNNGVPLPADYAPMGGRTEFGTIHEFMLFGAHLRNPGNNAEINAPVVFFDLDKAQATILKQTTGAEPPWVRESNHTESFAQTTRAAASADLDGDGIDEAVVVFVDRGNPSANTELRLHIFANEIASTPFAESEQVLKLEPNIVDINIAAGDLDGDLDDDLIVGLVTSTTAKLLFFRNNAGTFEEVAGSAIMFTPSLTAPKMSFRIVSDNLDQDRAYETAIILNEQVGGFPPTGTARYFIYDDFDHAFAELKSGNIVVNSGGTFVASVADIAIGDIDGDNLNEVVIGGIGGFIDDCYGVPMIGLALDDASHSFATLGQVKREYSPTCNVSGPKIRFANVNTIDLDNNGIDEIVLFNEVFDNFSNAAPWTFLEKVQNDVFQDLDEYLDRNTLSVTVGDASGDGREDLIIFKQSGRIEAWGTDVANGFGLRKTIGIRTSGTNTPLHAILLPLNLDRDSMVLRYKAAETKFVFTKPIVLAALAAPPCYAGIGQFELGCFTTFGTETSQSVNTEQVLSVTASRSVGFKVDGGISQTELSAQLTVSATAARSTGTGYSLTQSVVYTTGTQEDSVIFSTIPYDQYTYEVVSHPDPTLIGKDIVVSLPRSPITLMVERSFFNSSVAPGEVQLGSNVFSHVPGDVGSYMTKAQKQTLRQTVGGIETAKQSVGQGGGTVEIGLSVGDEYSQGKSLELGFSVDVEATIGGFVQGFSVGASVENSMTVTSGAMTSYTGSIGNLPTSEFANKQYSYGLFTYVFTDPASGQQFEVVNYWVE